jgi:hypothetical protein
LLQRPKLIPSADNHQSLLAALGMSTKKEVRVQEVKDPGSEKETRSGRMHDFSELPILTNADESKSEENGKGQAIGGSSAGCFPSISDMAEGWKGACAVVLGVKHPLEAAYKEGTPHDASKVFNLADELRGALEDVRLQSMRLSGQFRRFSRVSPNIYDVLPPRSNVDRWTAAWELLEKRFGEVHALLQLSTEVVAVDIAGCAAEVWVVVDMLLSEELPVLQEDLTAIIEGR